MKQLLLLIMLLLSQSLFSQGFEKDISADGQLEKANHVKEHNGDLYVYFEGLYTVVGENKFCSTLAKMNYDGEFIWKQLIPEGTLPFNQSFDIVNDTIFTIVEKDEENHALLGFSLSGERIYEQEALTNHGPFINFSIFSILSYNNHFYCIANGRLNNEQQALIYAFDRNGERSFAKIWQSETPDLDRLSFKEILVNPFDNSLQVVGVESNIIGQGQRNLYNFNEQEELIEPVVTSVANGLFSIFSKFKYTAGGELLYWDNENFPDENGSVDIKSLSNQSYDENWIYTFDKNDYQMYHSESNYNPHEIVTAPNGGIYICGSKTWYDDELDEWIISSAFVSKLSKDGDLLWERLIIEESNGTEHSTKWQYPYSAAILQEDCFLGVGYSVDKIDGEQISTGWMLKLNKDGCFNDDRQCPYLLNTGDIVSATQNSRQSLILETFPNPSNGSVNVSIPDGNTGTLKILTMQGIPLKQFDLTKNQENYTLNLNEIPQGSYILSFIPDGQTEVNYNTILLVK